MNHMLRSLYRIDRDSKEKGMFESHILFDSAFEEKVVVSSQCLLSMFKDPTRVNEWVEQLLSLLPGLVMKKLRGEKCDAPYGIRLKYVFPNGNFHCCFENSLIQGRNATFYSFEG